MPIFKKKKKAVGKAANPSLNSISIPTSQSLLDLSQSYGNVQQQHPQDEGQSQNDVQSSSTSADAFQSQSQKVIQGPPPGTYSRTSGRAPISPSSPSSPSLGAVQQFHRPQVQRGPPPSSFNPTLSLYSSSTLPISFNNNHHNDFRQSPFSVVPPNPSQQRKIHEHARSQSLKRSKVPKNLNLMVAGSKNTGKTSWIRSFLETLELGSALSIAAGVKEAAGSFGLSSNSQLPISTTSISTLSALPISDQALLQALPEAFQDSTALTADLTTETSMKRSSSIGGGGSGYGTSACRLLLSLTDTPGLDFQREDEFQIERKVSSTIRYIEEKMRETLIEEKKIDRRSHGGFNSNSGGLSSHHIHALLYFIDSQNLVMKEVDTDVGSRTHDQTDSAKLLQSSHSRQNSKSENNASTKNLLKRSNSESSFATSKLATRNAIKSSNEPSEESHKKSTKSELSLSRIELKILRRLAARVNIIPIVGCSDKLTENQLVKVREAVKKGMKEVLGEEAMFEILGAKHDEAEEEEEEEDAHTLDSPSKLKGGRRSRNRGLVTPPNINSSPAVDEDDLAETPENIKLIRIKSRRSFSRSGINDATFEMEPDKSSPEKKHSIGMSRSISSSSSFDSTSPLFSQDQDSHPLSKLVPTDIPSLDKMYPFSLISPEISYEKSKVSIGLGRARSGSKHSLNRVRSLSNASIDNPSNRIRSLSTSSTKGAENEKGPSKVGLGLDTVPSGEIDRQISEQIVPPVPPIPAQLQQTRVQLQEEQRNVQNSPPSQDNHDSQDDPDRSSPVPKIDRSSSSSSSVISRPRPLTSLRGPHPFDPNRFVRNYKWARINLLDLEHCDFLPLRALLLKNNVENLLRRTDTLYENYRSQRLENRRETREVPEAHEKLIRSLSIL